RGDGNGHLGRLPPFGPRAQRVTDHSLVATDIGLHQGAPIVTRCPLPAHAAALGDQLQVPVALRRRGLCRRAWHRARTWRHNDRRIRMTLADLSVDIVPIVRPISSKRRNRHRYLLKQGTDLRAVIDILAGQVGGDDLSSVGVDTDVELSPGPTPPCGMLLDQPLTGTAELEPCAVDQQMLPGGGCDTCSLSPRRLMVEWSGAARSRPSSRRRDAIRPSVWRNARRKTARSVSAVVIANAE